MTNFQSTSKKTSNGFTSKFEPLLFIPILGGLVISIILISSLLLPILIKSGNVNEDIKEMRIKRDNLNLLKLKLNNLSQKINNLKSQQTKLLDLIAGKNELFTYLSRINNLAKEESIQILEVKPKSIEIYSKPIVLNNTVNTNSSIEGQQNIADPLLAEGLEKRSVDIKIEGKFTDILSFLRKAERLPMIVITEDLKLTQHTQYSNSPISSDFNQKRIINRFDFNLSIYGKQIQ